MKFLLKGMESQQRVDLLLSLTGIRSGSVQQAVRVHLVEGLPCARAAARFGVPLQNLHRGLKRLNQAAGVVERLKELDWQKGASEKR